MNEGPIGEFMKTEVLRVKDMIVESSINRWVRSGNKFSDLRGDLERNSCFE